MKTQSTLFSETTKKKLKENLNIQTKESIILSAEKWLKISDDLLWDSIFSYELKRSHFVNSHLPCPSCGEIVGMYAWMSDPFDNPWKVTCPMCQKIFPDNDFLSYYTSGIDLHGIYRHEIADNKLLGSEGFIDVGNGFISGNDRWMFIATYIKYGLWEKFILKGILTLSKAYLFTGDTGYSRKCGIMLDRLADLFPYYDFYKQGVMYEEEQTSRGYIGYWCDTAVQLRELLLSYDMIFEALKADDAFVSFCLEKSDRYKTPNRKTSFVDIQMNIESRIFGDALSNQWKYSSNYPWAEEFIALAKLILPPLPDSCSLPKAIVMPVKACVEDDIDLIVSNVTKADGLTGEKGLFGYAAIGLNETARLLTLYSLYDPSAIERYLKRYPDLIKGIRFFIDSWFLGSFYPSCGDCGNLGHPMKKLPFSTGNLSDNYFLYSIEGFLWKMFKITGDMDIIRGMYNSADFDLEKSFSSDISLDDKPEYIRQTIGTLMKKYGAEPEQKSTAYEKWKLALLHSGKGKDRRGAFLDFDSGGRHGHKDGMNIGIFAKGIDMLPDLGYPPVHRPGSWGSKYFYWYRSCASHNTVIVDGKEHRDFAFDRIDGKRSDTYLSDSGEMTMFGAGRLIKAVSADDPKIAGVKRFERLLAMIDIDEKDSYFFDVFTVSGGLEHIKLTRGPVAELTTNRLEFEPYTPEHDPYGMCFIKEQYQPANKPFTFDDGKKIITNTMIDHAPKTGWSASWSLVDKFNGYFGDLSENTVLKYYDLTDDSKVICYDSFYDSYYAKAASHPEEKIMQGHPQMLLSGIAIKREGNAPLDSVFTGIYEPYAGSGFIKNVRRLYDSNDKNITAVEIDLSNGVSDLIFYSPDKIRTPYSIPSWEIQTDSVFGHVRKYPDSSYKASLYDVTGFTCPGHTFKSDERKSFVETGF